MVPDGGKDGVPGAPELQLGEVLLLKILIQVFRHKLRCKASRELSRADHVEQKFTDLRFRC